MNPRFFFFALMAALVALDSPLWAKDKAKPTAEVEAAPATATLESAVSGGWHDVGPGLDWGWADPALEGSLKADSLVPWAADPDSGFTVRGEAKGRLSVKDPQGSRSFLALSRVRGGAWLGLVQAWRAEALGVTTTLQGALEAGMRFESLLDANRDYEPEGANPADFWTRLGPRAGARVDATVKAAGVKFTSRLRAEGGYEAEHAYGLDTPAVASADAQGQLAVKLVDWGKRELRTGLSGEFEWSQGLLGPKVADQEAWLVWFSGKDFEGEAAPLTRGLDGWGWRASWQVGNARRLTGAVEGLWFGPPAMRLTLTWREDF